MNIIELARQAGFFEGKTGALACDKEELERFAALIRAEERERCAALCDRFAERQMHPAECAAAIRGMGDE